METDTAQLSGRELSEIVGERIMGWFRDADRRGPLSDWHEPACGGEGRCAPSCGFELPRFGESIEAATQVEDRIAKLGLNAQADYFNALARIVAASITDRTMQMFDVVHASAEQRCRAALAAIEGSK